jgi:hypothetical protein
VRSLCSSASIISSLVRRVVWPCGFVALWSFCTSGDVSLNIFGLNYFGLTLWHVIAILH